MRCEMVGWVRMVEREREGLARNGSPIWNKCRLRTAIVSPILLNLNLFLFAFFQTRVVGHLHFAPPYHKFTVTPACCPSAPRLLCPILSYTPHASVLIGSDSLRWRRIIRSHNPALDGSGATFCPGIFFQRRKALRSCE